MTPGALGAILVLLHAVALQDSVLLRFDPHAGIRGHRLFQSHTRVLVAASEGSGAAVASREVVDLGGITETVVRGASGEPVVHLVFDSLRTRFREGASPWRETAWSGLDSLWVQIRPGPRLEDGPAARGSASPTASLSLALFRGLPSLVLPDGWVRPGDSWTVSYEVPVTGMLTRRAAPGLPGALAALTRVTVDSLTIVPGDTLVHLSLRGTLAGGRVGGAGGGLAGSLVWSTRWSGFVAGATRIRVTVAAVPAGGGGSGARITVETTTRQRVRWVP